MGYEPLPCDALVPTVTLFEITTRTFLIAPPVNSPIKPPIALPVIPVLAPAI